MKNIRLIGLIAFLLAHCLNTSYATNLLDLPKPLYDCIISYCDREQPLCDGVAPVLHATILQGLCKAVRTLYPPNSVTLYLPSFDQDSRDDYDDYTQDYDEWPDDDEREAQFVSALEQMYRVILWRIAQRVKTMPRVMHLVVRWRIITYEEVKKFDASHNKSNVSQINKADKSLYAVLEKFGASIKTLSFEIDENWMPDYAKKAFSDAFSIMDAEEKVLPHVKDVRIYDAPIRFLCNDKISYTSRRIAYYIISLFVDTYHTQCIVLHIATHVGSRLLNDAFTNVPFPSLQQLRLECAMHNHQRDIHIESAVVRFIVLNAPQLKELSVIGLSQQATHILFDGLRGLPESEIAGLVNRIKQCAVFDMAVHALLVKMSVLEEPVTASMITMMLPYYQKISDSLASVESDTCVVSVEDFLMVCYLHKNNKLAILPNNNVKTLYIERQGLPDAMICHVLYYFDQIMTLLPQIKHVLHGRELIVDCSQRVVKISYATLGDEYFARTCFTHAHRNNLSVRCKQVFFKKRDIDSRIDTVLPIEDLEL